MPPKRAKSGGGSAGLAKWEQALLEAQFEEEEWKPNVTLVVGNKMEDYRHVDALHAVVGIPQRKLFSTVSKADLFEQVKELGNPKAKKGKETPQFYEICESVKPMLDEGLDVPILVLAKLIKFKLLDIKVNDLKRRDAEKKAAEDKAKGKTPGKDGKRPRSKSPAKGKGKKTPEPPAVKKDTKLKRRGEEDEENKYIDDEPDDGPQHYMLVHGFHQPQLVMALADVGVNVDALLKITSEDYTIFQTPDSGGGEGSPREEQKKDEQVEPVAGAQEAQQDIERQQRQKAEDELKRFWKFLDPVLRRAPAGSRLHDMARLEYVVVNTLHPSDWEDPDKTLAFGTAVFEDVACKIYDMYDWRRQFQHYLSNMKLLHVPLYGEAPPVPAQPTDSKLSAQAPTPGIPELDVPAGPPDVDMRYYSELMNTVPQESVSIPLIMHCMLEQVSATEEDREPPSERPVPPRQDGVDPNLAAHMGGAAVKLALSEEEQMALDGELDLAAKPAEDKNHQRPLLLQYGDGVSLRTHHLKQVDGFQPQVQELKMVHLLPVARLCELPPPSTRVSKERAARLQELLHFCATGNLSLSEIDRAFKQFVFESMVGSTTDKSGMVLEPPLADEDGTAPEVELDVPWDDPFPFYQELKRSGLLKVKKQQDKETSKKTAADPGNQDAPQPGTPVEEGEQQPGSRPTSGRSRSSRPTSARLGSAGSNKSGKEQSLSQEIPDENKAQEESKEAEEKSQGEQEEEDQSDHVTVNLIEATQKRQLDDWCFAEHFEPEVLIQVLDEAKFKYSHMDSYYHKRDHSMMMVFHNPLGPDLHNHTAWNTYLHSDVGFRNYLEHVTENISDWVRVEEAKFQAELLAKELALQKTPVTTPDTSRPSSSKSQRKRSQSPKKKSRSPSGKRSKRGSAKSPERPSSAARPLHVRENSLKAWKEEQDIIKAEEERKAREKEEKRAKSASKKASRERGSSAGSTKSKSREKTSDKKSRGEDKEDKDKTQEPVPEIQEPTEPEVILPFTGYDVGNELVHAAGESVTLFPCDGGIIRTEKNSFVQDGVAVRTSVLKDGHLFVIHILDPRQKGDVDNTGEESVKEKADLEKSEKEEGSQSPRAGTPDKKDESAPLPLSRFGSFTAVLKDGMCLSLSNHGPSGKPKMPDDMSAKEVDIMTNIPPASTPTPPPPSPSRAKSPRAKSPKGKPKSPKGKRKEPQVEEKPPEPEEPPPEPEEPEEAPIPPFQQLFVSCPDGLNIRYFLEKDIGIKPETVAEIGRSRLLVRQTYPFKTRGLQKVEDLRKKPAMQEVSRCVNSDGTVVKVLHDGSTQVLFADGTISENPGSGPIGPYGSRSNSPSRPPQSPTQEPPEDGKETPSKKKAAKGGRKSITTLQEPEPVIVAPPVDEKANQWVTTSPSGERVATKGDGTPFDVKAALLCQASDPESGAVVVTREDKVISVHRPDDSVVVEHRDGTRITTFYKDVIRAVPVDENETGESPRMETARVKHTKVECVGYATLLFNSLDGSCMTVFGNGTSLMTNLNGTYQLYHGDGGRLDMDADGTTVYAPRPDNDLGRGGEEEMALGSYVMRHNTEMCCEMVDLQGNVFQVAVDGTTSVIRAGQYGEEEGDEEEDESFQKRRKLIQYGEHCPRFFIIHANGSGTELLRPKDVAEYLSMAARDPTCALIQDPLPEYPGVTGITVLKPHTSGISQSWLKKLDEEVIMPKGLKSRDLKTMSVSAEKTPGPSFGTNVGKGLSVGSVMSSPRPVPVLHCPDTLEIRQLVQYKPVSEDLRKRLQLGLKAYAEHVLEREQTSAALMVQDPRTEEEKIHAADLASQTIFGQAQETEYHESADKKVTVMEGDVSTAYEKAVEVPPPEPPPTPRNKRTQDDWDRDRRELAEEQEGRNALKNKDVPPYFESEMGKHFLMSQAPDMDALTRELAHDPRRDGSQVIRSNPDSPISVGESPQGSSGHLVRVQETFSTTPPGENTPVTTEDSPSLGLRVTSTTPSLRPTNPTPAHASGTGTPTPLRPKNPTPHAAGVTLPTRPGNPTPTQDSNSQGSVPSETPSASLSLRPTTIPEHPEPSPGGKEILENSGQFTSRSNQVASSDGELVTTRSLLLDVNNQPRKDTVRLPRALDGGKPGSLPNQKFSLVEEPVRRKVQTSSVAGASYKGVRQMGALRGLMAVPDDVDFGVLREGNTYVYTVQLKNVGVDSCRFKVKQPPPSTGLRVLYNPGPIAAGMKADLSLEIYAIAVGAEGEKGVGQIAHHIEITTETDLMYLPVTATILTAAEHDNRSLGSPRGGKAPAAKLISTKPPSGQGILRPRRDVLIEGLPTMG